jgi:hypothetical protein
MKLTFVCCLFAAVLAAAALFDLLGLRDLPPQPVAAERPAATETLASAETRSLPSAVVPPRRELPQPGPALHVQAASVEAQSSPLDAANPSDPATITGAGLEQVIQSLSAVADDPSQGASQPLDSLKDWLKAHAADGAPALLQALEGMSTNQTNLSRLLIQGLTEADPAVGEQVVLSILSYAGSYPPTVALQAAAAAGNLDTAADPTLKQTLLRLVDWPEPNDAHRVSETALFSFARLAGRDPEFYGFLAQRLNPWLEDHATPQETVKAFTILAQAGVNSPDFVQRATALYQSPDESIRAAAEEYLTSLAWAGTPEVE